MLSKRSFKILEKLGFWNAVIVTSKLNWCSNGVAGNFTKPKTPYFRAFSGFLTDIAQADKQDFCHGMWLLLSFCAMCTSGFALYSSTKPRPCIARDLSVWAQKGAAGPPAALFLFPYAFSGLFLDLGEGGVEFAEDGLLFPAQEVGQHPHGHGIGHRDALIARHDPFRGQAAL